MRVVFFDHMVTVELQSMKTDNDDDDCLVAFEKDKMDVKYVTWLSRNTPTVVGSQSMKTDDDDDDGPHVMGSITWLVPDH